MFIDFTGRNTCHASRVKDLLQFTQFYAVLIRNNKSKLCPWLPRASKRTERKKERK